MFVCVCEREKGFYLRTNLNIHGCVTITPIFANLNYNLFLQCICAEVYFCGEGGEGRRGGGGGKAQMTRLLMFFLLFLSIAC